MADRGTVTMTDPSCVDRVRDSLHDVNLLGDLEALATQLDSAASHRGALGAFLLSAGINQIAEDYLHDSPYPFDDAAMLFRDSGSPAGRLAGSLAAGMGVSLRALGGRRPAVRRALGWQRRVAAVVDLLADTVIEGAYIPQPLVEQCRQLVLEVSSLPVGLRQAVVRLPACFRDFDQRPEDLQRLAERFTDQQSDRARPLLVVGVRTSGSYLAPLIASALRACGFGQVRAITIRPDRRLLAHERALVSSFVHAGGQVLLTDDPPATGSSLATAAAQLERVGIRREMVVLVLALEDERGTVPPPLLRYDSVLLARADWAIEGHLKPDAVRRALAELLEGELELQRLESLPLDRAERRRGHRRALFRVHGYDLVDGTARQLDVLASATGVGYFGEHELMVARALSAFAPRVVGHRNDVLYREWLPDERRLRTGSAGFASAVAAYVAARRHTLSVTRDLSAAMSGQRPVWEVAALMLARGFAPVAPVMRAAVVNRVVRRLLTVPHPSVVDGSTTREHWFTDDAHGRVIKVGLSDRSYWRLGLACFDASFDVVGAGAGSDDEHVAAQLRAAWLAQSGEEIAPERWLLYELVHLWGRVREDPAREAEVRLASARAVARYFAGAFLADLVSRGSGPLCALDIDGVMETDELGFPTLSRASATALRALLAHGYRPVLTTGRGIAEVRDRCRSFGLEAGVAEYGAAICLEGGERAIGLVDPDSASALQRLRLALRERNGVRLDPAFVYAVRAYRLADDGRRRPLGAEEITECLDASGSAGVIRATAGENQTDFTPARLDKGSGLRALISALEADGGAPSSAQIALAVGDTVSDAPMLALAPAAFVPAHASQAATTTGARRVRRPYQAGLYVAVGELLGHRPGSCPRCRVPPLTSDCDLLLDLLSVVEDGRRGVALRTLGLAWKLRRG